MEKTSSSPVSTKRALQAPCVSGHCVALDMVNPCVALCINHAAASTHQSDAGVPCSPENASKPGCRLDVLPLRSTAAAASADVARPTSRSSQAAARLPRHLVHLRRPSAQGDAPARRIFTAGPGPSVPVLRLCVRAGFGLRMLPETAVLLVKIRRPPELLFGTSVRSVPNRPPRMRSQIAGNSRKALFPSS